MRDASTWTPPRSLTFSGRMSLTWSLCSGLWKNLAVLLKVMWSAGATASFSPTDPLKGKSVTVSAGPQSVTVTFFPHRVTPE